MLIVGVRRTSLRNLRSYSALIDELEGLPNAGQVEGPPNAALMEGPPNAGLVEGPPNAGLVEGPPNAEQQNNTRREEILVEMNAIENRIMAMDIVYVCLNKDIDALVEISDKRGGYGGLVKVRPANAFATAYIAWRVQEGNFNFDLGN
ncbi:hypothetical protein KY290_022200 [Solanum tuberosum]|uniref:Uncharacterized protein n=1 Tax=Solanum tuberosum TaxID=4113 RepID=A0ABQ7V5R3_SOLTU|nr:hypothetical protein KY289_021331 [Solanum tuberosum]KAH0758707.1 hypothetical protein KY290_022200 [Solanum tuberosum]